MHLWPSTRLRDSFKKNYLKKLEWNLHRMNIEKQQQKRNQQSEYQQKLLETDKSDTESSGCGGIGVICREVLMILSCCYCCFCCGGLVYMRFPLVVGHFGYSRRLFRVMLRPEGALSIDLKKCHSHR